MTKLVRRNRVGTSATREHPPFAPTLEAFGKKHSGSNPWSTLPNRYCLGAIFGSALSQTKCHLLAFLRKKTLAKVCDKASENEKGWNNKFYMLPL